MANGGDGGRAGRAPTHRSNNPRTRGRSAQAARNREARVEATSILTNQSATLAVFSVLAVSLFADFSALSDLSDLSGLLGPSALSLELWRAICDVPAGALEHDSHRLNDPPDRSTALRALCERIVGKALHGLEAMSAGIATVGIRRHCSERSPDRSLLYVTPGLYIGDCVTCSEPVCHRDVSFLTPAITVRAITDPKEGGR